MVASAATPSKAVGAPVTDGALAREMFLRPLLSRRRQLGGLAAALLVQNLADLLLLANAMKFFKALFTPAVSGDFSLLELFPAATTGPGAALTSGLRQALLAWAQPLLSMSFPRAWLALIIPLSILVGGVFKAFATYLYQLHLQGLALFLAKDYRQRLFRALLALPYVEVRKRQVGEWMSLIMNDVMFMQSRFTDVMTGLVKDSVSVLIYFLFLSYVHWPTALALLAISPAIAFGMGRTGKRIARYAEAFQRDIGRIAGAILDLRARFDFIRAQGGEARETGRFAALNTSYFQQIRRSIFVRSAFAPLIECIGYAVFAGFVFIIGRGLLSGLTPDVLVAAAVALGMMIRPLREIGEQLARFHETRGTMRNSLVMFRTLEAAAVAGGKGLGPMRLQSATPETWATPLAIQRLSAGMDKVERFAAESLRIAPGRAVAVIGPSGAGKSTLVKTLAGLVEPLAWEANLPWPRVTAMVSMVSQEPFLFDESVEANLLYGLPPSQTPIPALLWQALATVNIAAEIKALPLGLATRLHAIGSNVSGGQLQRLVIARALLRESPIWVLDEATSAVDAKSEKDITLRLIAACHAGGKALLAVTHRLTWLEAFDEVWFVEHGRLSLSGPHRELLANPRYQDYVRTAKGGADGAE